MDPRPEDTLMMRGSFDFRRSGIRASVNTSGLTELVLSVSRSSERRFWGWVMIMPALLMSTSSTPNSVVIFSTAAVIEASLVMSSSSRLDVPAGLRAWTLSRAVVPLVILRQPRMTWLLGEAAAKA